MGREISRVMWNFTVNDFSIREKIEATAAGGFDTLAVAWRVFQPVLDGGTSPKELLAIAEGHGVKLDFLDGMSSWHDVRYPPGDEFMKAALDFSPNDALRFCDDFGLTQIVASGGFARGAAPETERLVDDFGRFCERAAKAGISVDLEPMPISGIDTPELAWEIVRRADCANSAVHIDTWHLLRSGSDPSCLRSIPKGWIRNVQLVDGGREPQGTTLWDDVFARSLPGEGELPIVEILQLLRESHEIESVGPEAIWAELDLLPARDVGVRAGRATERTMAEAGFPARA